MEVIVCGVLENVSFFDVFAAVLPIFGRVRNSLRLRSNDAVSGFKIKKYAKDRRNRGLVIRVNRISACKMGNNICIIIMLF
jgi:hypothetical protein